ncbi:MAG: ATP synthase archaeal subunit H [Methanobacteriaceae archaeon]|nr:ATP synthase archaeal subunit H [Methanobacteriaceae archaeon]
MASISETISNVRKAESDADSLIENANQKSAEMIQNARTEAESCIDEAKNDAFEESKHVLLAKEEEAKKEAVIITNESDKTVKDTLRGSEQNVEAAADTIIKTVL